MGEDQKTILIIDDNKDYLFTMEMFLSRNGFNVITASDGKQGVELVQEARPDIILLDVMMEALYSGFEVCRRIRSDPAVEKTPIIGISGMKDELGVQFDIGSDDSQYFSPDVFFDKPVDKDALLAKIGELLAAKVR